MPLVRIQGDFVDLLPPGGQTSGPKALEQHIHQLEERFTTSKRRTIRERSKQIQTASVGTHHIVLLQSSRVPYFPLTSSFIGLPGGKT